MKNETRFWAVLVLIACVMGVFCAIFTAQFNVWAFIICILFCVAALLLGLFVGMLRGQDDAQKDACRRAVEAVERCRLRSSNLTLDLRVHNHTLDSVVRSVRMAFREDE